MRGIVKSMVGSIGLNSIVLSSNLKVRNLSCGHAVSFKSLPDTFQSVPSSFFKSLPQAEIEQLIKASNEIPPIDKGFTSQVFKIGDKVLKKTIANKPASEVNDHVLFQNVREFFALKKIESIDPSIATKAHDVIQHKGFYSLVEDFVEGVHPHKNKMSSSHLSNLMSNFSKLDINGIVNADLQPKNIFLQSDGTTKLIDFGSYVFLTQDGMSLGSDGYPSFFFLNDDSVKNALYMPSKNKVANTFFGEKFYDYKNKVSNPYLRMHSNASNFEFRTLHSYLMKGPEEKPLGFFRNYLKTKGENYHAPFRDFLKTINLEQDTIVSFTPEQLATAKTKLASAIDFEDVASQVLSNPTDDVLKAELARIQLRLLMSPEHISSNVKNQNMLKHAYNQLDDLLNVGLRNSEGVHKRYFQHCLEGLKKQSSVEIFEALQVDIPKDKNLVECLFASNTPVSSSLNKVKNNNKKLWALAATGIAVAGVVAGVIAFKNKKKNGAITTEKQTSSQGSTVKTDNTIVQKPVGQSTITEQTKTNTSYVNNPFANVNTPNVFSQFV